MEMKHLTFSLLILFSFLILINGNDPECIYNLYVQSGSFPEAGTQSNISIFLSDDANVELPISNLKEWGLMGSDFNYLKPGEINLFAGKGPCLHGSVCRIIIILSGYDDWYCDFIEVTSLGYQRSCYNKHFTIKRWLDVNKGSAVILLDQCPSSDFDIIKV